MFDLQKNIPFRSHKIMDSARNVSYCMMCKKVNDGTIVGAHYSGIRQIPLGKGTRQKPTDSAVAYLCNHCHTSMDNYYQSNDHKRSEAFMFAIIKSHDWLFKEGIFK